MPCFLDGQLLISVILLALFLCIVLFCLTLVKNGGKGNFEFEFDGCGDDFSANDASDEEKQRKNSRRRRVLIILSDFVDLVLYFGPILFALIRSDSEIFVLSVQPCFGKRYHWLKRCTDAVAQTIGFAASNIIFVWNERFPNDKDDDPWPIFLLMRLIYSYANVYDVDFIVTYDYEGINDNVARQAINEAVTNLWRQQMLRREVQPYLLASCSVIRAFCGFFDSSISYLWAVCNNIGTGTAASLSSCRLVSSLRQVLLLQRLYLLCEWPRGRDRDNGLFWVLLAKVYGVLVLNRYFHINRYHKIQEDEKYRL